MYWFGIHVKLLVAFLQLYLHLMEGSGKISSVQHSVVVPKEDPSDYII